MILYDVYQELYQEFGPQKWWPTTAKVKKEKQHEIIIGAILTQATNWKNVERALFNLRAKNLLNLDKIKQIPEGELSKIIRPSGFFNQKAKRLKSFAIWFKKNAIASNNLKELRRKMLDVKGLGPETVDSILLYAFELPIFVIDAYTKRFAERYPKVFPRRLKSYEDFQKFFMDNLPKNVKIYKEFHALIVRWEKKC